MPSLKCYECGKVKRCRLYVEELECHDPKCKWPLPPGHPHNIHVYLCAPCARELGR